MNDNRFTIRPYRHTDLDALYLICLQTAASGEDGSELYRRAPRSVGDYYAAPYAAFAPNLVFMLEDDAGACGYVLGVADTAAFEDWFEAEWFPLMQDRYAWPAGDPADLSAAERLIRRFHRPLQRESPAVVAEYPAHLHIDLLGRAQGQGMGPQMMQHFLDALRAQGVPGVHLGLGLRNHRALRFYERLGFSELELRGDPPNSMLMGLKLD